MSRKKTPPPAAAADTPITEAKTMQEFVIAANRDFDLNLPESWPEGSVAATIEALEVTVVESPDGQSYTATAKTEYPDLGRGGGVFKGRTDAVLTPDRKFLPAEHVGRRAPDIRKP